MESYVRLFKKDDAGKVSAILVSAFKSFLGEKFDDVLAKHFSAETLVDVGASKDYFHETKIFVATCDEGLVGAINVTAGINGLGALNYVGVDPECHAKGVGALLMRRAEEFWKERRQRKIHTCVTAHNKKALLYYIKNDFVPEGYCRDHFYVGVDEIMLGRFLGK